VEAPLKTPRSLCNGRGQQTRRSRDQAQQRSLEAGGDPDRPDGEAQGCAANPHDQRKHVRNLLERDELQSGLKDSLS
jgi:hypothetical protein